MNPSLPAAEVHDTVIYERISLLHIPVVLWHLFRHCRVEYFEMHPSLQSMAFLGGYRQSGLFTQIDMSQHDPDIQDALNAFLLKDAAEIIERELGKNTLVSVMEQFFQTPIIRAAFRKATALEYLAILQRRVVVASIARERPTPGEISFIPHDPTPPISLASFDPSLDPGTGWRIPLSGRMLQGLFRIYQKARALVLMAVFPVFILAHIGVPSRTIAEQQHYQLGIRVYRTDIGFNKRHRNIDFLLDGVQLRENNSLFCIETDMSQKYMDAFRERHYHHVPVRKSLARIDLPFVMSVILRQFLPVWLKSWRASLSSPPPLVWLSLDVLHKYLLWTAFLRRYRLTHYVVYNDTIPSDIVRNILMKRAGTRTWYYEHSINTPNLFQLPGQRESLAVLYSSLYFDTFVSWNDTITRYYQAHPNLIREYLSIGCLWSEHVRMIRENRIPNTAYRAFLDKCTASGQKIPPTIIGVFDTSFGGRAPLQSRDMAAFLEGILSLLDGDPDLGVLFKMKWSWSYLRSLAPQFQSRYEELKAHPRCLLLDGWTSDPSEVIAASDLVISACFTATTVETLGARKKAIFYDATNRFRGCYFDRFPLFVAHDLAELHELVPHWLSMTDEAFAAYLDTYIRTEVDPFVDGRAITRFRDLLSQP